MLQRFRSVVIRRSAVLDQEIGGDSQLARGCVDHVAEIAETVMIGVGRDGRIKPHEVWGLQVGKTRWVDAQRQDHRSRLRAFIGNLIARTNLHLKTSWPASPEPWQCPAVQRNPPHCVYEPRRARDSNATSADDLPDGRGGGSNRPSHVAHRGSS
jgi:hypothetical protein